LHSKRAPLHVHDTPFLPGKATGGLFFLAQDVVQQQYDAALRFIHSPRWRLNTGKRKALKNTFEQ
jgi:hypothetical protein